ncbi:MAG TPA: hypothetical protein PK408_01095, partial [Treponemataceae bacterium]|nr:hypothetical protein [Treponemataceae bacterium]
VLIDGHHRREGALRAGLYDVPCYLHEFASMDDALAYAISLQTERRNLSDAELIKALKVVDTLKTRGLGSEGEKGKSAARSAQILGISTSRVEKTRFVEKFASEDMKTQIERGDLTLNKAYQMLRNSETASASTAGSPEKKMHKEVRRVLQTVHEFLEKNDVDGLKLFVQNQLV